MTEEKQKRTYSYPEGYEPDYIRPETPECCTHRFALGKNPLVAICMNPSAADLTSSDQTVDKIIKVSRECGKDGWMVFNVYPERATDPNETDSFDQDLSEENNIDEVWVAWGNRKKLMHSLKEDTK